MTGIAQVAFPGRSDGSLLERDGTVVGSRLLGQSFSDERYFHPRPSAAGDGYDGAVELGVQPRPDERGPPQRGRGASRCLSRAERPRSDAEVPGRRRHLVRLGPRPAHLARERAPAGSRASHACAGIPVDDVLALVDDHTDGRSLGFLGEPGVNVLELNLALDALRSLASGCSHGARNAPHLPRGGGRGRQDLRDAERGSASARLRRGRRGRASWRRTAARRRLRRSETSTSCRERKLDYRDGTFEELDVDAVLARKPQIALVDELAHTNVPGSRNEKRWEDVEELLEAGINVISTMNVQHLESLNDVVEQITGVTQRETIPDAGRPSSGRDPARRPHAARAAKPARPRGRLSAPSESTPRSPTTSGRET